MSFPEPAVCVCFSLHFFSRMLALLHALINEKICKFPCFKAAFVSPLGPNENYTLRNVFCWSQMEEESRHKFFSKKKTPKPVHASVFNYGVMFL